MRKGAVSKRIEANIIVDNGLDKPGDEFLFFGNSEDPNPKVFFIPDAFMMSDVLSMCGIFPSKSQAKKAGWNKPIPEGFSIFEIGKLNNIICILKARK